jgi:hypothetical protein
LTFTISQLTSEKQSGSSLTCVFFSHPKYRFNGLIYRTVGKNVTATSLLEDALASNTMHFALVGRHKLVLECPVAQERIPLVPGIAVRNLIGELGNSKFLVHQSPHRHHYFGSVSACQSTGDPKRRITSTFVDNLLNGSCFNGTVTLLRKSNSGG